jgi:hypothetical protein
MNQAKRWALFLVACAGLAGVACAPAANADTDTDGDYVPDFTDDDDDGDGFPDGLEVVCGSDPKAARSIPSPPADGAAGSDADRCRAAFAPCEQRSVLGLKAGDACTLQRVTGPCAAGTYVCVAAGLACRPADPECYGDAGTAR